MAKKRILIVEDERLVAEQLQRMLATSGYEIAGIAHSGEGALTQAQSCRPDLVLMDIVLPGGMDGISAAQLLYESGIPVVYLTGYSDKALVDRAKYTEPLAYIVKPAKPSELTAVIELALFKRQEEQTRLEQIRNLPASTREVSEHIDRLFGKSIGHGIITLDLAGNITSWNSGAAEIMGYSAQEIVGRHFRILFTEQDQQQHVPELELVLAQERGSADNTRWMTGQNGTHYWAEGVLTVIHDERGTIAGFAEILRDATKQKQMQDALLKSETTLRIALGAARMGTWMWNLRTNCDTLDENLCALFGLTPEKAPKTIFEFFDILQPEDRQRVEASFLQTRETGIHLDTEFRVLRPDGTERWFIDQGEVLLDAQGQPEYMAGACVDITERKQAESLLRASEERFRLFVSSVQDYALLQMDEAGRIVNWNSGANRLLGYELNEIVGKHFSLIFVPEDIQSGQPERELQTALAEGRSIDERWHRRKDGTRFWCSGVMSPTYNDSGHLFGFAKVMRDDTSRRSADQALKASLVEKEVLLKEIHHRVKNNLQVITSLLSLQSDTVDNQAVQSMFDEASNRVRSIGEIHELLDRSIDLGHIEFKTYLDRLSQHLLSFYGVDRDKVQITVSSNADLPLSQAVPCGLIANELLTNSIKHAFPGGTAGRIKVRLNSEAGTCVMEVIDNGVGLAPGFKLDDVTSLGLRLVSVLAKQLGGELHLHKDGETSMKIVFPESDSLV